METLVLSVGALEENCIIAWNDPSAAWIIDPGAEPGRIVSAVRRLGLAPALVALTHAHFDHIGAIPGLLGEWPGLPVHIAPGDVQVAFDPRNKWEPDYSAIDRPSSLSADLLDGALLEAGGLRAEIAHTPGHTPGSVCFVFREGGVIATGDTLFAGSCGRTDFPGGDPAAMRKSLARLAALPPELRVIAGHGPETTIARETACNPYMTGLSFR